mmetsp:Transcript_37650/g.95120  ORF Transcript_37650/g.95120 Transcript_37650/m.95120 type:complete len:178 (+) Transcript_37650:143-676(+)
MGSWKTGQSNIDTCSLPNAITTLRLTVYAVAASHIPDLRLSDLLPSVKPGFRAHPPSMHPSHAKPSPHSHLPRQAALAPTTTMGHVAPSRHGHGDVGTHTHVQCQTVLPAAHCAGCVLVVREPASSRSPTWLSAAWPFRPAAAPGDRARARLAWPFMGGAGPCPASTSLLPGGSITW